MIVQETANDTEDMRRYKTCMIASIAKDMRNCSVSAEEK
jgi:hypothetical protein